MSVTNHGDTLGLKAAADYSTKQHFLVKQTADDTATLASAATDIIIGSIKNKPRIGEVVEIASVTMGSTFKVKLGGNAARGTLLVADGAGKAIVATQTTAGAQPTQQVFGRALQAGSTGDIIEVEGTPQLY